MAGSYKRKGQSGGVASRGAKVAQDQFTLSEVSREDTISSSVSSHFEALDLIKRTTTSTTTDYEYDIVVEKNPKTGTVTLESTDEGIATVDQDGIVDRVSDGNIRVVGTNDRGRKAQTGILNIIRESGETIESAIRWTQKSLMHETSISVDSRIVGLTPASSINIYTTQDHSTPTYVRNTSGWAVDLDLTCISPWNSNLTNRKAGTLISPRHIIFSEHYQIANGSTIRFIQSDNTVVERTMTSRTSVGPSNSIDGYATDLTIGLLDSDVPVGISFCKVLPATFEDYVPNLSSGMPCLCLDQQEKALITDFYSSTIGRASFKQPVDADRFNYYESKISGDSGNPAFLIIDDELVLVTCWTFGGAGSGPNISKLHSEINAAMTSLGGGYQLTVKDLDNFTKYNDIELQAIFSSSLSDGSGNNLEILEDNGGSATFSVIDAEDCVQINDSSYVVVSDDDNIDFGADDSFSISCWIRTDGTPSSNQWFLNKMNGGASPSDVGYTLYQISSGTVVFLIADGTTRAFVSAAPSGDDFARWIPVVCVLDRSDDSMKLYLDGALVDDVESDGPVSSIGDLSNAFDLWIGHSGDHIKYIRNLKIFRRAISAEEVAVLATEKSNRMIKEPGSNVLRNNYNGFVGYAFTANQDIVVNSLGRPIQTTFLQDHDIRIWEDSGGTEVASATVTPDSEVQGGFARVFLDKPITLLSGVTYVIATAEFNAGDDWLQLNSNYELDSAIISVVESRFDPNYTSKPTSTTGSAGAMFICSTFYYE